MNISTNIKEIPTLGAERAFAELAASNKPHVTYEVITKRIEDTPLDRPSPIVSYEKPINIALGEPVKRLTIKVSEAEYEKIQRLYDFTNGRFDSLDTMLRQMILQPELWYKFITFLGYDGNEVIDFVTKNKPEGFNWC